MAKQLRENKASKRLNRYFLITKVFLAITPLICYFYVSMRALMLQATFQEVLVQEPNMTIIFLIAMINPYIAYLVQLIQQKLEKGDRKFAMINMVLLLIAQALTMNVFYFTMLAYVFYKAIAYYRIGVKETIRTITLKQSLYAGGGSFFVICISSVCLFATIRLM